MLQAAPVSADRRLEALDVLRGFALLGILGMNIRGMAAPLGTYLYPYALFDYTGLSRAAYIFTSVVFDLKMMGLFSMLFGAGVLLYAAKEAESGRPATGLWLRRMGWLLVMGLLHAYLIWGGDILVPYALCGLIVLWWVRNWSARALFISGLVVLSAGAAMSVAHGLTWDSMTPEQQAEEAALMMPTREQTQAQLAGMFGSYTEVVAHHAPTTFLFETLFFATFFFWRCSGMMLLGMALYKWGFLDGRLSRTTYVRTAVVGIGAGLTLAWYGTVALERVQFAMPGRAIADMWNYAGAILASIGYAAVFILIVKSAAAAGLRRRLAAVGRMAFSNYLFHSIITSVLFLGWGFGLAGRLDYAEQLLVVVAIWAFQLYVSPLWLTRYRFGPAEWAWRSLTYGKRQPMLARPRLAT